MLNTTSSVKVGLPCGSTIVSGYIEPHADTKNITPANISERLRPQRVASTPEMAEPMMQPMSALELVKPCQKSVYVKSSAPMKKACKPFSAPEITAVS